MLVIIFILIVLPIVGGIILAIVKIVSGGKIMGPNQSGGYDTDSHEHRRVGFFDDSNDSSLNNSRANSAPFDNHWESSFDWKDEDNDGYDDRDDGFWNEREF